ncbi:MAG: PorV/PorQ family protein [Longimicrobiales bacterium]
MDLRTATAAFALAVVALPASASAQDRGGLPKLLTLPASTRAMALGGAYQPTARHSDGIFYNPALVNGSTGMGVDVQQWGRESSAATASAALPWFGGSVAVGLQTLQLGVGGAAIPDGEDHLFDTGGTAVSERIVIAGYARKLFGVDWGVAGKLAEERVGAARGTATMVDVGAARGLGPVVVGVSAMDLGNRPFDGDDGFATPRVVLGAGAYGQPVGIFDVGYAAAVTYTEDRTSVGGGVELGYWPITGRTFVARLGAQSVPSESDASPFTFGFAFWGDDLRLEWAWQDFGGGASGTHRFGVAWH